MMLLDLIFPKTCLECGSVGKYLCFDCLRRLTVLTPVCPYCEKASVDGVTHPECSKPFDLDGLTSIWDYEGVVKKAILAFKFKYATEVGKELAGAFIQELKAKDFLIKAPVLVPVPVHWYRENVRGFNQSEEIGKEVAKSLEWRFAQDVLIKRKSTASQVELSVENRKKNLKGVFSVLPNVRIFQYSSIVLFDDVFTTGSTLKEAAKVLKTTGIKNVWGLTIAR